MIELPRFIDGDNVELDKKHKWGFEIRLVNNELYCSKYLVIVHPLVMSSLHYHKNKDETFSVLSGEVNIEIHDEKGIPKSRVYTAGMSVRIKPGTKHRFYSLASESWIQETSTHHDDDDTYRLIEGGISV